MKKSELRQIIREEILRMKKLAGIITENVSNDKSEKNILTPKQKKRFLDQINDLIEEEGEEYAFDEAGNVLARILTNNKAEFLEDVENFGYNPNEVEDYAQNLIGNTDSSDLKNIEVKNIETEIQNYLKKGSKGDLLLNKYKGKTLPSNFPKVERDLVLNNSSIISLPKNLSVGGTLFLYNTPIAKKYSEEELKNMLPGVNNFYI